MGEIPGKGRIEEKEIYIPLEEGFVVQGVEINVFQSFPFLQDSILFFMGSFPKTLFRQRLSRRFTG
jgi:hypothetical protein